MTDRYLLSIITVVYNSEELIEETIKSIVINKDEQIEYIVIDGGSSDNTLGILRKYERDIDILISESDNGIYDAMNKGIMLANGTYILNINAGDKLITSPLIYLTHEVIAKRYDLLLFNVLLSSNEVFKSNISFSTKFSNTIHHQGALYLNNTTNLYNTKYSVFSDFDYNQRLYSKKRFRYKKIDHTISYHEVNGISHNRKYFSEVYNIVNDNFSLFHSVIAFFYFKYRGIKKRIRELIRI